jgi:hypothetical protein
MNLLHRSISLYLLILIGCGERNSAVSKSSPDSVRHSSAEQIEVIDTIKPKPTIFSPVLSFPLIEDTAVFIGQLKEFTDGDCGFDERLFGEEKISFYRRIKINGSDQDIILVEYKYTGGPTVCFPYKQQFLFKPNGKLFATMYALRFEMLRIFPGQKPFLLTVTSTARGNGGHQLYKVSGDTLENIYEGYMDYEVQTYDAGEDQWVFEPNALKASVLDVNKDGVNDLVFSGKIVLIQGLSKDSIWYDGEYSTDNPFKKLPIRYVFLYDKTSGRFKESKKYSNGNPFNK